MSNLARTHVALSMPDIVSSIVAATIGDLIGPNHLSQSKRAYSLARVSRIFFHSAIPYVWENVETENLLQLVPPLKEYWDTLHDEEIPEDEPLRQLSLHSWVDTEMSRLHFYGPMIKQITHISEEFSFLHELAQTEFGRQVIQYMTTHIVLPNLQEIISVYEADPSTEDWDFCLNVVPQSLNRLQFAIQQGQGALTWAETMIKRCPQLDTIVLWNWEQTIGAQPRQINFSILPSQLPLKHLGISESFLCPDMLAWAAELPILQHLDLAGSDEASGRTPHLAPPATPYLFKNLTTLDLGFNFQCEAFLQACRFPHVVELSLDCSPFSNLFETQYMHRFGALLAQRCPKTAQLSIKLRPPGSQDVGGIIKWLEHLKSLHIMQVNIIVWWLVDNSAQFKQLNQNIARLWPGLENLAYSRCDVNLQAVVDTISLFPSLNSLAFDTIRGPWVEPSYSSCPVSSTPLELVSYFANYDEMDEEEVASWLSHVRPGIHYEIYAKPPPIPITNL